MNVTQLKKLRTHSTQNTLVPRLLQIGNVYPAFLSMKNKTPKPQKYDKAKFVRKTQHVILTRLTC